MKPGFRTPTTRESPNTGRTATMNTTEQFLRAMMRFEHATERHSKGSKLTRPQRAVLEALREPKTPSQIADSLHLHRSTISGLLVRLQHAGLIRSTDAPSDRRSYVVALSAKGRRAIAKPDLIAATVGRFPGLRAEAAGFLNLISSELEKNLPDTKRAG
jgi:DNA-binding MarR family transcriptional regulator